VIARATRWAGALLACGMIAACASPYEEALLIGHRGSPIQAPENSFEGFELAYHQGADGLEFDVQWTQDDRNVVMHDDTLDRTTTCTGPVRERTLDALRSCTLENGEPVALLEEMLAAFAPKFEVLFLEIKIPDATPPAAVIEAQTDDAIDLVLQSGYAHRIVVISYDEVALKRIAERAEEGIVGGWDEMAADGIADANRHGLRWVLMPSRVVEPWMRDVLEGLDKRLAIYQVITPTEVARSLDAGAKAVMTDDLPVMAAMLGRKPK
jgi:glycerophosphoryl diester phosphodiesterase